MKKEGFLLVFSKRITKDSAPLRRTLALSLVIVLAVPHSAFALRQTSLEEQEVNHTPVNYKQALLRSLVSDASAVGRPARTATGLEEPLKVIEEAFKPAPDKIKPHLVKLFESRVHYFDDVQRLAAFRKRVSKFGKRMLNAANYEKLYDTAVHAPFYGDVLFLMLARGTVKDLVWEHA